MEEMITQHTTMTIISNTMPPIVPPIAPPKTIIQLFQFYQNNFIPAALLPSMLQCPTVAVFVNDEEYANNYNGIMNNSCIAILTASNCHIL